MRIFAISDLHSEFGDTKFPMPEADVCVLAGDIGSLSKAHKYESVLKTIRAKYEHVVLVPGNHEFYGSKYMYGKVLQQLKEICDRVGVVLLNQSSVVIDGVRFVGAILWTHIDVLGWAYINDGAHVFRTAIEMQIAHKSDLNFLERELKNQDLPTIIVTHHLPHKNLIHPKFADSKYNSAFMTDVSKNLNLQRVPYWFCGHTHEYVETVDGIDETHQTRIIANPVGYPGEDRVTCVRDAVYIV